MIGGAMSEKRARGSRATLHPTTTDWIIRFTHDSANNSHPSIQCPERGNLYSVNEGNQSRWDEPTRRWAAWIKSDDKAEGLPYGHRYVGSLVADAHRTLLKGGVFAYPADTKSTNGKLRLLYEANPMAFLFEQSSEGRGPEIGIRSEAAAQSVSRFIERESLKRARDLVDHHLADLAMCHTARRHLALQERREFH